MNIPNIDSKIMARAFALALSVEHRKALFMGNDKYSPNNKTIVDIAKGFEQYLIGDADLPEVKEDYTKEWIDTLKDTYNKQAKERIEKMNGYLFVTFKTEHREWVISTFASLGDKAEIIEPKDMRNEMKLFLEQAKKQYKT